MCSYFSEIIEEASSKKADRTSEYSVLNDPAYRERYKERILVAQKNCMDVVQCPDGTIILIENKFVMYSYGWNKKKRDFERAKMNIKSAKDLK